MRSWRKSTWAILIWTALIAIWIIVGVNNVGNLPATGSDAENAGRAIGTGIGVTLILMVWFIGFIVLAIVWFMSRPRYVEYRGQYMKESDARKLSQKEARADSDAAAPKHKGGGKLAT